MAMSAKERSELGLKTVFELLCEFSYSKEPQEAQ